MGQHTDRIFGAKPGHPMKSHKNQCFVGLLWCLVGRRLRSDLTWYDLTEIWACNLLRIKHFHEVWPASPHAYSLKSQHGKVRNYRYALADTEPDRVLYLAVPLDIYEEFFTLAFIQSVLRRSQLHLLVYDVGTEEITQWHP